MRGSELASLIAARDRSIFAQEGVADLKVELKAINEALWRIEDAIRECERGGDFGPRFVNASSPGLCHTNDRTTAARRSSVGSTERLGSEILEAKSYAENDLIDSRASGRLKARETRPQDLAYHVIHRSIGSGEARSGNS